ncbi:hypothetical protein D3C76_1104080 [compost metagenome]
MQHHVVACVADGAEHGAFQCAGGFQQCQRLVAVAGEHHIVEAFGAGRAHEGHATFVAADPVNPAIEADAISERSAQRRDIAARAAFDHPPLWALVDRQQAVVATETHEELKGEVKHVGAGHRPDRRPHRHDVVVDEALPIALCLKVGAQGGVGVDTLVVQVGQCLAVEPQNIPDHAPETRGHQVAALGKQCVQVVAVVLQASNRVMHGETHLGRLRSDLELVEQPDELGVGPVVENDEAGIDCMALALPDHIEGMRVAPDPLLGFENRYFVLA